MASCMHVIIRLQIWSSHKGLTRGLRSVVRKFVLWNHVASHFRCASRRLQNTRTWSHATPNPFLLQLSMISVLEQNWCELCKAKASKIVSGIKHKQTSSCTRTSALHLLGNCNELVACLFFKRGATSSPAGAYVGVCRA